MCFHIDQIFHLYDLYHRAWPRRMVGIISAAAILLSISGCATASLPAAQRPASWAQPVACEGLPNCFKVSDSLYRGAQPTSAGLDQLAAMGIHTIINLRAEDNDGVKLASGTINYIQLPMSAW